MYPVWGTTNKHSQERAGRETEPRQRSVGRIDLEDAGLFPLPACWDPLSGVNCNIQEGKNLI